MADEFVKFDENTRIRFLNPPVGELLDYAPQFKVHYSKEKGCLVHTVDESKACLFCTLRRIDEDEIVTENEYRANNGQPLLVELKNLPKANCAKCGGTGSTGRNVDTGLVQVCKCTGVGGAMEEDVFRNLRVEQLEQGLKKL